MNLTMSNHSTAVALNNQGLSLLGLGYLFKAFDVFTQAYECLNECNDSENEVVRPTGTLFGTNGNTNNILSTSNILQGNQMPMSKYSYEWLDFSSTAEYSERSYNMNTSNDASIRFLCLSFVKINICNELDNYIPDCDDAIRWVITYNLALANNILGVRLGEHGRFLLEQAHHYYIKAQLVIPPGTPFYHLFRLFLSAQNNQISIYFEFGMHEESRACLKTLTEVLLAMPHQAGQYQFNHEILLNLMVFSKRDTAAAA